ncbi:MAG: hypothetical protein U1F47_03180 [Hyphomicrobiales bacterium]
MAQLAAFEYAATKTSTAVRDFILNVKPGLRERDAVQAMGLAGSCSRSASASAASPRARYGLPSPGLRVIERGDPIVVGHGLMGALNCRAGWLVANASELPVPIRDYVDRLVAPYFSAAAAWYETVGIGVTVAEMYEAAMRHVGDPFFGVGLNPGHLIHR